MSEKKVKPKTKKELKIMAEGGRRLAKIKKRLREMINEGVSAKDVDDLAAGLIKKEKGKASFKMVPGYSWTTCVNVNSGIVHGIPKRSIVFKKGDIVSVDIGFYYQDFHTDTSFSIGIGSNSETKRFLREGEKALKKAIKAARPGNRIHDISKAIEDSLKAAGLFPIKALVGHGIGRSLHEEPHIPCFVEGKKEDSPKIPEGAVFAIEVMYTVGNPGIMVGEDGWTISTKDDKIAGLFEETVAVYADGPLVLTT